MSRCTLCLTCRGAIQHGFCWLDDNTGWHLPSPVRTRGTDISRVPPPVVAAKHFPGVGKQSVDLIITDYRMSPVNGLELIAKVRCMSGAIPVVLLYHVLVESLGLTPENTGANVVIQKVPMSPSTLLRTAKKFSASPKKPTRSYSGQKPGVLILLDRRV